MSKFVEWGGKDNCYRYALWRLWDISLGYVQYVGLNPSTADDKNDDPTIRRCISYAKQWGYGGLCMTNLFAYRATVPKNMMTYEGDPVGPLNDDWLVEVAKESEAVIACWGTNGSFLERDKYVSGLIPGMKCLKLTKGGHPHHPLRLPNGITLLEYNASDRDHRQAGIPED